MFSFNTIQFYDPFEKEQRDFTIKHIKNMQELYDLYFLSKETIIINSQNVSNLKGLILKVTSKKEKEEFCVCNKDSQGRKIERNCFKEVWRNEKNSFGGVNLVKQVTCCSFSRPLLVI